MLQLTRSAKEKLHASLARSDTINEAGKCFRIIPKDEKTLTLTLAEPDSTDSTFTHEGQVILALPEILEPLFEGRSLDIDDGGKLTVS
jgi:hypothetical protein